MFNFFKKKDKPKIQVDLVDNKFEEIIVNCDYWLLVRLNEDLKSGVIIQSKPLEEILRLYPDMKMTVYGQGGFNVSITTPKKSNTEKS